MCVATVYGAHTTNQATGHSFIRDYFITVGQIPELFVKPAKRAWNSFLQSCAWIWAFSIIIQILISKVWKHLDSSMYNDCLTCIWITFKFSNWNWPLFKRKAWLIQQGLLNILENLTRNTYLRNLLRLLSWLGSLCWTNLMMFFTSDSMISSVRTYVKTYSAETMNVTSNNDVIAGLKTLLYH